MPNQTWTKLLLLCFNFQFPVTSLLGGALKEQDAALHQSTASHLFVSSLAPNKQTNCDASVNRPITEGLNPTDLLHWCNSTTNINSTVVSVFWILLLLLFLAVSPPPPQLTSSEKIQYKVYFWLSWSPRWAPQGVSTYVSPPFQTSANMNIYAPERMNFSVFLWSRGIFMPQTIKSLQNKPEAAESSPDFYSGQGGEASETTVCPSQDIKISG